MPQRTDERFLRFMEDRGFVPNEPNPKPLLKPIYKFIKRVYDSSGEGHKVEVSLQYGYSKKVVAGLPQSAYIAVDDVPWRYRIKIRGKHKIPLFFDESLVAALLFARNYKLKDKDLKAAGIAALEKRINENTDNTGHASQDVGGRPDPTT